MSSNLNIALIESITLRINESLSRIETCLKLLDEDLLWKQSNKESNSIGNLILHLNGNITQYIISGLAGANDLREREKEFDYTVRINKKELLKTHKEIIEHALKIIQSLREQDLTGKKRIQGFETNPIDVLIHVTEHYSYHTGQIALLTKLMTEKDLGFYAGQDLNDLNEG